MFFSKTLAYTALLFLAIALIGFKLSYLTEDILDRYAYLQASGQTGEESFFSSDPTRRQERLQVQKNVWMVKGGERLHLQINSKKSLLFLTPLIMREDFDEENSVEDTQSVNESLQAAKYAMIEHLEDMTCFMQEEIFYRYPNGKEATKQANGRFLLRGKDPRSKDSWIEADNAMIPMQFFRYMRAKHAMYDYQRDVFKAEAVDLWRFCVQGVDFQNSIDGIPPLLKGKASSVEFHMLKDDFQFHAERLKLSIYSTKGEDQ